ncbi:MAG: hypothetical protein OEY57_10465 [Nitrospirota bacterium]|nr:hypothetical protein [Nitrospirota bacterium]
MVICLSAIVMLSLGEQAEARKKRTPFVPPVKVEEVATSPDPFIIGQGPLTISMRVKVPLSGIDGKVLEVSGLITSPTRRSMSFLSQRLSLAEVTQEGTLSLVPVELVWDGKDQNDQFVADGSYYYEIQAKVMEDEGYGPRTKIVSHRVQGTLEALAYVGEVLPPLPPEPELPDEIEALQQEELAVDGSPLINDDGVIGKEDPSLPGEELAGDQVLEGSSGGDPAEVPVNGTMEDLVPGLSGEPLLKEADALDAVPGEPSMSLPMEEGISEPISERPLEGSPTEPSLPSQELPFQH